MAPPASINIQPLGPSHDTLAAALCRRALGNFPGYKLVACHPLIPPAKKTEFIDWYFESRISQCRDGGGLVAGVFEGDKLVAVGLCKPNGENFGLAKLLKEWEEKWGQAHLEFAIRIVQEADEHVERLIVASDFHLFMLSTLESMRGRGIGSEMLRSLLSWAKTDAQKKDKPGSIKIDLDCPTEPLVRMYEKFNSVLRGRRYIPGRPRGQAVFHGQGNRPLNGGLGLPRTVSPMAMGCFFL